MIPFQVDLTINAVANILILSKGPVSGFKYTFQDVRWSPGSVLPKQPDDKQVSEPPQREYRAYDASDYPEVLKTPTDVVRAFFGYINDGRCSDSP